MSTKRRPGERFSRRHANAEDMSWRSIELKPDTWDENTRSVECVIATDNPIMSTDSRTGKGVMEVWRMDGAEFNATVPLCDNHQRSTVRQVLGSVRDISTKDGRMVGRLYVSEAEPNIATKVREGHIRDVSGGIQPLEGDQVQRGQTRHVRGIPYTAPADRDMKVLTRWRLREVSLTPIGADPSAKIRSGAYPMNENLRKFLETIGLRSEATADEAKAFYDELPEATRAIADAWKPAVEKTAETPPAATAVAPPADMSATQRAEVVEAERTRVREINRLGEGLPGETVRKAIDEGWDVGKASVAFLEATRTRTAPAGPSIHTRGKEQDCTVQALGYGLALRNVDGERLLNYGASYVATGENPGVGSEFRLRRALDRDAHKKAMERALDEGDRYRSLSLVDICREACRIDGNPVPLTMSPEETFRTAVSGSALSVIFTTNINAEFMSGYMDYSDTTVGWCSESDKNNFLTNEVDTMGKFGTLKKVTKGRPAEHLNTSDWKESYKLARYGGQFVIDEQDVINDRFGALESESPRDMGLTAAQLRPNLVYGIILENGVLDVDGVALFDDSTHGNYKAASSGDGGPLAADSLQAAIVRMAKQRINGRVLNIKPRYLIVPQDLKFTAGILLKSAERVLGTNTDGTYNPLKELDITLVVDDRIGVGGVIDPRTDTARAGTATNFYLSARPGEEGAKTIEVGYRRGTGRAPVIRSFVLDKGQWGIGWDINFDIGGKALDFRAMYKSKGAA